MKKAKIPVATAGPSALGAGVGAVTGGSDAKLIALVAVLAGLAALALGKAVYRRRAER